MGRQDDATKCMALAILNFADDEGYFYADLAAVRSFARPFDEDSTTCRATLDNLEKIEYIEVRDHHIRGPVGRVVSFDEHQRVDKAKPSEIKKYFNQSIPRRVQDASTLEGKGKEGNGSVYNADPEKQKNQPAGPVEIPPDSDLTISAIAHAHPRLEKPIETERAIANALEQIVCARFRGDTKAAMNFLMTRTKLYRECTSQWPPEEFITGSPRWFSGGCYDEDEQLWRRKGKRQANGSASPMKLLVPKASGAQA